MCLSPTNTSKAYTCWSIIINIERFQHASTVKCMPNTCTESGSYPLKYKLHIYYRNHHPSLSIYYSIKRKTPAGYEKNWQSPLKKHGFSCFINNSKSMHKSVPGIIYLNSTFHLQSFRRTEFTRFAPAYLYASSRSRNLLLQILPQVINRFFELYICTIMSVTLYNPAQDTETKPQSYINKCSTSKIFNFSCT